MKTKLSIVLVLLISMIGSAAGQGFVPPAEGKAAVYFVRVSSYGSAAGFDFFHQDNFIGTFSGTNYLRYECDPGEQLFWASSENKEFLTSDLQAGGSYVVLVDIIIGFWKAHVGLTPLSVQDGEQFERAKEMILSEKPVYVSAKEIEKMNNKLADFMTKELKHYEETKTDHNFKHISPEMAVPEESMH